jgi:tetratricopeptide (TPR) repeat protein
MDPICTDSDLSLNEPRPRTLRFAMMIVAAGILAYSNSFSGLFILDDDDAIATNPHIRQLWPLSESLKAPAQSTVAGRPVVSFSLAVNYALGGLAPWGYHAFNLAVHLAAGLILFGLVRRTLLGDRLRERYRSAAQSLAGIAALLWVIHPLQTESVTYVIQRAESMSGLFYLLVLYAIARGRQSSHPLVWYGLAVAASGLGMATKEVMVTAPVTALLYDRAFLSGSLGSSLRRRWPVYVGLAGTWAILAGLIWNNPRSASAGFGLEAVKWWEYARTQPEVILHYLRLCFWPAGLCLDYNWPVARGWAPLWPSLVVLALLVATLRGLWRNTPGGFVGAWFWLVLAPTSSIVPLLDLAFEHRMYLPLGAVAVAIVIAGHRLAALGVRCGLSPGGAGNAALVAAVGVTLLLMHSTFQRNKDYQSAAGMWRSVLTTNPRSVRARTFQARDLVLAGRGKEAEQACRAALEIKPDDADVLVNLGIALVQQGRNAEGAEIIRRVIERQPDSAAPRYNLAYALQVNREFAKAVEEYRRVQQLEPRRMEAYVQAAVSLAEQGYLDEAMAELRKGLHAAAGFAQPIELAEAHLQLAMLFQRQHKKPEALAECRKAVALEPRYYRTQLVLGILAMESDLLDEAISAFRAALAVKPDLQEAEAALATALRRAARETGSKRETKRPEASP